MLENCQGNMSKTSKGTSNICNVLQCLQCLLTKLVNKCDISPNRMLMIKGQARDEKLGYITFTKNHDFDVYLPT